MYKTIKSKKEIVNLFKTGKIIHTQYILFLYENIKISDNLNTVAFIAGKKLGKSTKRNFLKRRLRSLYLLNEDKFINKKILMIAKKNLETENFWIINKQIENLKI